MVRHELPNSNAPTAMSATHRENEVGAGGQKKMVPLARLERALPKKTDFESGAQYYNILINNEYYSFL